ncbi:GNAT family N-acetyltransferase [Pseudoduganella armeniaca]|nr:GNAT family N-acetyltransferase [Pseudoduganella armeniaca]
MPPPYVIASLPRLDANALAYCDFSFDVTAVAVPPFSGNDIAATVAVAPYRKDYGGGDDLVPEPDGVLLVAHSPAAVDGGSTTVLGYVLLSRDWTGLALVDDIAVDRASRGLGIGRALLDGARDWARAAGLAGLRLETQSTNVPACRFYARQGLQLGGADRLLYAALPGLAHETALFWYQLFAPR